MKWSATAARSRRTTSKRVDRASFISSLTARPATAAADWKHFAGIRSRQQCRSSSQGAQKEDATRGRFSRDEAPRGGAASQCGGAVHVTVVAYDDYRVGATWEVASCNAGTSAPEACERALCDIIRRLQQHFDIASS